MTEDSPEAPPPKPPPRGCLTVLFVGFLLSGVLGAALGVWAAAQNAPFWVFILAFLGPPGAFLIVFGSAAIPRLIREAREIARNVPSPESRAAVAGGEAVEAGTSPKPPDPDDREEHPTVPEVPTTPGTVLPHRLPRAGLAAGCKFGCSLFAAAFWNGIVGVFLYQAVAKWNRGGGLPWFEVLFLTPFVLVGLVLIGAVFYTLFQWLVSMLVGSVSVEVSAHPLAPGAPFRVHVAQAGLVPLGRVGVSLVCTESATYVAGTSKSTAKNEAATHPVSDPDSDPNGGGLPLTTESSVPADAMHSFAAPNNEIQWTFRVTGRILGMPFGDDYSVCVSPGPATTVNP